MAQRDDFTIRWDLSPRLITVAEPSTEVIIQDEHDTLREAEAETRDMVYDSIVSTAGGEDLGGGVTVGLTSTLLNAQIKFQSRYTHAADGYATSADVAGGTFLTDINASFISDGVVRGALITNFSDLSYATVVRVISETQLEHEPLADGTGNNWEIGDYYKIHNIIQCEVTGGNLVAVDDVGADIDAISPSAFVQIIRTSASSATSRNDQDIEFNSFNGAVTVDLYNSTGRAGSGTAFPSGTLRKPCDDFADALTIMGDRGFDKIQVLGNALIDSGSNFKNFILKGESSAKSNFIITSDAQVSGCEFRDAYVTGILDGYSTLKDCVIGDLTFFDGLVHSCGLEGIITLAGGRPAHIINCYDNIAGFGTPTIDMGGSGQPLIVRNYNGGLLITNKDGDDGVSIDVDPGRIILDSTVTNGEIIVRGVGKIINNSSATVDSLDLIEGIKIQKLAYVGAVHIDSVFGTDGSVVGVNGLQSFPCSNFDDALVIGTELNFKTYTIGGSVPIRSDVTDLQFIGTDFAKDHVILDGYQLDRCFFEKVKVIGNFDYSSSGYNVPSFINCYLEQLSGVSGRAQNCLIDGYISLRSGSSMLFVNLATEERTNKEVGTISPVTLDVNGGEVVIQGLDGYLLIENVNTVDSNVIISMHSAHVYIAPSCTNGSIIIRGTGSVTNAGVADLNTSEIMSVQEISSDVFKKTFPFLGGTQ